MNKLDMVPVPEVVVSGVDRVRAVLVGVRQVLKDVFNDPVEAEAVIRRTGDSISKWLDGFCDR